MWNLFVRIGAVLSTLLIGKELVDRLWPAELRPTRLYRAHQVARYLGVTPRDVVELIQGGHLSAQWLRGEPVILGASVLDFLSRAATHVAHTVDVTER